MSEVEKFGSKERGDDSHRKAKMQVESLEPRIMMSAAMFDIVDDATMIDSNQGNEDSGSKSHQTELFEDDSEIADLDLDFLLPYMATGIANEIQVKRKMQEVGLADLPNETASTDGRP